jgi:SAM-dependent methyltransferase
MRSLNCDGVLRQDRPVNRGSISITDWLATPLGRRCLANEQRAMRAALDRVFGEQLLQIGLWGARGTFLRYARTQRRTLVDWESRNADILSDPEQLAIASDSIDAVLLPHTLERTESPHALLREVDRVLRADGQLLVLSVATDGLWGLRHYLSPGGYPRGRERGIREGRLRDWLELLSFEVGDVRPYCHTAPIDRVKQLRLLPREDLAKRWTPMFAGGYLLRAQKRVRPLTPIKLKLKPARLRVVGGIVEPAARARLPAPDSPARRTRLKAVPRLTPR